LISSNVITKLPSLLLALFFGFLCEMATAPNNKTILTD
jgi:hypothetical protein